MASLLRDCGAQERRYGVWSCISLKLGIFWFIRNLS